VWLWIEPIRERVFSDSGPSTADEFLSFEYDPAIRTWAISEDDNIVACALVHAAPEAGTRTLRVFWRSSKVMVDALRMIVTDLFNEAGVHRIEWRAWADAVNVLDVARKAGGTREAILKSAALKNGVPADQMSIVWVKE